MTILDTLKRVLTETDELTDGDATKACSVFIDKSEDNKTAKLEAKLEVLDLLEEHRPKLLGLIATEVLGLAISG